jgi:hypothetical protein
MVTAVTTLTELRVRADRSSDAQPHLDLFAGGGGQTREQVAELAG